MGNSPGFTKRDGPQPRSATQYCDLKPRRLLPPPSPLTRFAQADTVFFGHALSRHETRASHNQLLYSPAVTATASPATMIVPDERQQEAIGHVHGPMLVIAGAGTGKTTVLT